MKNCMRRLCFCAGAGALFVNLGSPLRADAAIPPEDSPIVAKLIDQLGADDPTDRDKAAVALEDRPDRDLPLLEAASQRDDLSPEQRTRLHHLLSRIEPRAKLRKRNSDFDIKLFAWTAKEAAEYYEKDGHTNHAWDAAARQALELDGKRPTLDNPIERQKADDAEQKAFESALAAGCNDPDVLEMAGRFFDDHGRDRDRVFSLFRQALDLAGNGRVSPEGQVIIAGRVLRARAAGLDGGIDRKNWGPTGRVMERMLDAYTAAVQQSGIPPEQVISLAYNVMTTAGVAQFQMKPIFDRVDPALEKAAPNDSRTLNLKGWFYTKYAWEARGGGWANTVTPQGWKDFGDRLATANDLLTQAWQADPDNPDPPTNMLTVALGQDWPIADVQKWYQRAMDANPDNHQACTSMLYYLEPKWHGSPEAMLQFGRQCFETGNWHGDVAFMLVDAHVSIAKYADNEAQYYQNEAVWSDISTVYTAFLDAYPDNAVVRTKYARFSCLCGRWSEANDLFKKLGDNADPDVFGGAAAMQLLKDRAASEVKAGNCQ